MSRYNKKIYEQFKSSLKNYRSLKKRATIEKSDYHDLEKDLFKCLKSVLAGDNLPPKDDFYDKLFGMFDTMVECRTKYFTSKGEQADSLFYFLLIDVCDLKLGQSLSKKVKQGGNKTEIVENILNKIKTKGNIYNANKRKHIALGLVGGAVIAGTVLTGGTLAAPLAAAGGAVAAGANFFGTALTKLPIGTVVDIVGDKAGKINVGYTSMSKGLWQHLGTLPDRYQQIKEKSRKKRKKHKEEHKARRKEITRQKHRNINKNKNNNNNEKKYKKTPKSEILISDDEDDGDDSDFT